MWWANTIHCKAFAETPITVIFVWRLRLSPSCSITEQSRRIDPRRCFIPAARGQEQLRGAGGSVGASDSVWVCSTVTRRMELSWQQLFVHTVHKDPLSLQTLCQQSLSIWISKAFIMFFIYTASHLCAELIHNMYSYNSSWDFMFLHHGLFVFKGFISVPFFNFFVFLFFKCVLHFVRFFSLHSILF